MHPYLDTAVETGLVILLVTQLAEPESIGSEQLGMNPGPPYSGQAL